VIWLVWEFDISLSGGKIDLATELMLNGLVVEVERQLPHYPSCLAGFQWATGLVSYVVHLEGFSVSRD
jgi:hypothetical protein